MAPARETPRRIAGLRRQAEDLLGTAKQEIGTMPVKDVQQLVHELQVNQIELEMQNDEFHRVQVQLEAARDRYVNLYDFAPCGYLTLDTHSRIVEANLRAGTMLGINRKELIGQSLARFIESDDEDTFHRHCQDVVKTCTRQTCEVRLKEEVGRSRWILFESLALHEEAGHLTYWRTALLDITDRKRAENALRESEERMKAIVANSPALIFLKDTQGRYLQINHTFERIFHVLSSDIVGKTDQQIFSAEQAAAFRANDRKVLEAGRSMEFEEVALHDDGPHTSIVVKFPLLNMQGECYALCGIVTDITERKRAEELLKESEERYRSIFENAVEGIFHVTRDGTFIAVNPALAAMYGYDSPDDMIARITDLASQPYVDPARRDEFLRLLQTQENVTGFEAQVYRKDSSCIWISANVRTRRDQAGVCIGYEGTVEQLTERKLAEARLRETLEEVRLLSGRLATAQEEERTRIARELHDELGVRLTCLKIDLSRLQTAMISEGAKAGFPRKAGDRIRSMVEQVDTTIASVQRLVTELRPAVLDNLGLVAAIEWQCQDFQKRTGIPCTCVASADDIALGPESTTALFRICQEALTNVARHAQATAVTVTLECRQKSLQLVVADNGRGIPATKVSDRLSLGLLGMRERLAQCGGEMTIQGQPEKGTTVTAWLPRCQS